jgi:hypothetical protein
MSFAGDALRIWVSGGMFLMIQFENVLFAGVVGVLIEIGKVLVDSWWESWGIESPKIQSRFGNYSKKLRKLRQEKKFWRLQMRKSSEDFFL